MPFLAVGINPKSKTGSNFHINEDLFLDICGVTKIACPELIPKIGLLRNDMRSRSKKGGNLGGKRLDDQKICAQFASKITYFLENKMWWLKERGLTGRAKFLKSWVSFLEDCGGYVWHEK